MSTEPATVALRGWGESSDGYHMSAPDPAGVGARLAMERALARAGVLAAQIDYINLHGTGTLQNDAMESRVIHALFGAGVAVSSTKPFTGHALGAAGAIEADCAGWRCRTIILREGCRRISGMVCPILNLPVLRVTEPGSSLGSRCVGS